MEYQTVANMSGNWSDIDNVSDVSERCPGQSDSAASCNLFSVLVYSVFVGLLCILGTIGNIVCFIVFWNDKIKTSSNFLFQALSLVDIFLLVSVFPIYTLPDFVSYTGLMQGYLDLVHPYFLVYILPFAWMAQTATIWLTVLVAVNRYIAVCKPYQASRLCTVNQAKKQLAVVLIFAILYNVPKFPAARVVTGFDVQKNTTLNIPAHTALGQSQLYHIIYSNILYLIFLLILPLLILTLLNIRLIRALNELQRKRVEMQSLRQQQDNNVTFVLIIVVLVFSVCQSPALVNQILWNVLHDCSRLCGGFQYFFSRISNALVILNSSVNFVVYYLFNTRFRQVLEQSVCKRKATLPKIPTTATNGCKQESKETTQTLL